jgi:cytochrome b
MVIYRLRQFHLLLAVLVLLAYFTGDDDALHYWLGYGVALLIVIRLIWGLTGVPQLGLMKYYPQFEGLKLGNVMTHPAISRTLLLGIALSVIVTAATGVAMDRGKTLGLMSGAPEPTPITASAQTAERVANARKQRRSHGHPEWLEDIHELAGNLVLIFVGFHVTYLLLFKRQLALFMAFIVRPGASRRVGTSAATPRDD